MSLNEIRIVVTLVSLLIFMAIVFWAYWPANRARFDADAYIPLNDDPADAGHHRALSAPASE
jgi:cytochrome c oxidase cbb3-type subunit IV